MKEISKSHIDKVMKLFEKNYAGMKVVRKGKGSYLAIMLRVPKKGSGAFKSFVQKGLFTVLPSIETAAPAIATFFVKIGFELLEDVMNIYQELKARKETDEDTMSIVKDVLKKKYKNMNVVMKKLITYPLFESILVAIAMKSLPDVDPTGQTSKIATHIGAQASDFNNKVLTMAMVCPTCGATSNSRGELFTERTLRAHVASHKGHNTRRAKATTVVDA